MRENVRPAGPNSNRVIFFQGSIKCVCVAYQIIHSRMLQKQQGQLSSSLEKTKILIPDDVVARIIGKSGTMIKKIETTSKGKIEIQHESEMTGDPNGYYGRTVSITGTFSSRLSAVYLIIRHVSYSCRSYVCMFDTNRAGLVQVVGEKNISDHWKGGSPPLISKSSHGNLPHQNTQIMYSAPGSRNYFNYYANVIRFLERTVLLNSGSYVPNAPPNPSPPPSTAFGYHMNQTGLIFIPIFDQISDPLLDFIDAGSTNSSRRGPPPSHPTPQNVNEPIKFEFKVYILYF